MPGMRIVKKVLGKPSAVGRSRMSLTGMGIYGKRVGGTPHNRTVRVRRG